MPWFFYFTLRNSFPYKIFFFFFILLTPCQLKIRLSLQCSDQVYCFIYIHILMILESIRSLYLEHGSLVAGGQAGDCFKCDETIRSRLTDIEPKPVADRLHEFLSAAQCTRQICADLHAISAFLLIMIQRIKPDDRSHISFCDFENFCNILHGSLVNITLFALGKEQ